MGRRLWDIFRKEECRKCIILCINLNLIQRTCQQIYVVALGQIQEIKSPPVFVVFHNFFGVASFVQRLRFSFVLEARV